MDKLKIIYCYAGDVLFKMDIDGWDYWINPKFHERWQLVDGEHGPHPNFDDPKLSKEEAWEFAKKLGMTLEAFEE